DLYTALQGSGLRAQGSGLGARQTCEKDSMSKKQSVILAMLLVSVGFASRPAAAASCESLARLALPHTTITLANAVDAGGFVPFPALRGAGGAPPAAGAQIGRA